MALKLDRDHLLAQAISELERARIGKQDDGEYYTLEFRNYLVQTAKAYIELAREVREAEEFVERRIDKIREDVCQQADVAQRQRQ